MASQMETVKVKSTNVLLSAKQLLLATAVRIVSLQKMGCWQPGADLLIVDAISMISKSVFNILYIVITFLQEFTINLLCLLIFNDYYNTVRSTMRIQVYFLVCLSLVVGLGIWQTLFPDAQFLEISCVGGEVVLPNSRKNILDCAACKIFPIQKYSKGVVEIRSGSPQQLKKNKPANQSQLFLTLYMQKECVQFECHDLINQNSFSNEKIVHEIGLEPIEHVSKAINDYVWIEQLSYNNQINQNNTDSNAIVSKFLSKILGPILPYSVLPSLQFSYSMALKMRVTQPLETNIQNLTKPQVKITTTASTLVHLVLVCMLIGSVISAKLKIFSSGTKLEVIHYLLCFGFLSPYLFSMIALVIMAVKNPIHIASLLWLVFCLCTGYTQLIQLAFMASAFIQKISGNKQCSNYNLLVLYLLFGFAFFFNLEHMIETCFIVLYAFCLEEKQQQYRQIRSGNRMEVELKESDEVSIHF